jgi:hypothetical protein
VALPNLEIYYYFFFIHLKSFFFKSSKAHSQAIAIDGLVIGPPNFLKVFLKKKFFGKKVLWKK